MAQGRDTISQRISLEGAEDIIAKLRAVGEAGEKTIHSIEHAINASSGTTARLGSIADSVRKHFTNLHESMEPIREKFSQLHEASHRFGESLNNTAEHIIPHWREVMALATGGAVAGFVEVTKHAIEYVQEIKRVSDELGVSVVEYQRLDFTLRSVGLNHERFVSTFSRLARSVGEASKEHKEHIESLVGDLYGKLNATAVDFVGKAGHAGRLVQGVIKGQEENITAMAKAIHNSMIEMTRLGQAGIQVRPVTTIMQDLRNLVQDTSEGAAKLRTELYRRFNINLPVQQWQELVGRAKDASAEMDVLFNKLGVRFQELDGTTRPLVKIFDEVGAALGKVDQGTRQFYAQIILNRGFKEILPLYAQGAHELSHLREEFDKMNISVDETNVDIGSKLYGSFAKLSFVISTVEANLVTAFGPNVQGILDGITELVVKNAKAFVDWGRAVAVELKPGILELFEYLKGEIGRQDIKIQWVRSFANGLHEIRVGAGYVATAFHLLVGVLQQVADVVNVVFGTEFTGKQLLVIALVLKLTGVLGTVLAAINLIRTALILLATTNPWVFLITTFIIIAKALYDNWDQVKENLKAALAGWIMLFEFLGMKIMQVWDNIKKKILEVLGLAGNQPAASAEIRPGSPALMPFGGGGSVPGSGRGDHVHALLEPEEYVVRGDSVRRFGVNFFDMLNNGVLPGFSLGGLVARFASAGAPAPLRMATGGLVPARGGGTAMFHLTIGDNTYRGLSAPEGVAKAMLQDARTSSIISAGPRPSWENG